VLRHMPNATILRPSVIFGTEDRFFNRFAAMARYGPFLPLVGADTRFQPVWVEDVAEAADRVLNCDNRAGVYELGGPDVRSLRALVIDMLGVIHRRRIVVGMPFAAARPMAWTFDMWQKMSVGLIHNAILTRDQVKLLRHDNVVSQNARGFDDLGLQPATMAAVLPGYLWKFRPSGQYDEIRESAANLRG
jgi:uncharacterized protein YbjT (DUF2867 family)